MLLTLPQHAQRILNAQHEDPFSYLGAHENEKGWIIRVFQPNAKQLKIVVPKLQLEVQAVETHSEGLFEAQLLNLAPDFQYQILWVDDAGESHLQEDAYRFDLCLSDQDLYFFGEGRHWRLYEMLGAHLVQMGGVNGTRFAVWAPNAQRVSVVGDFNRWDGRVHSMRKRDHGVWELFIPHVGVNAHYKFEILNAGNEVILKSDPVAFFSQHGSKTASLVWDYGSYSWQDQAWMQARSQSNTYAKAVSIYEVHLGSWRRGRSGEFLTYQQLGDQLIPYVVKMGFTHIELMPISEYPFDGSWGYQVTGYYAPTSRFGNPDDFRYFIDRCHQAGIGVIIDWVPAHFPKDLHGLARFDGTALFEHEDPRLGEHMDWGTLIFNYGRNEVRNFLIANALFWLEQYHIDGIRVDAVASMLYLDYSRKEGEWVPNRFGGRENLEAIDFLRELNRECYAKHPGVMMIAEESTSWPGVSHPTETGGLGFGYKWNMGWMNDSLRYMQEDPIYRKYHHHQATFSLYYAFHENFMLVLSHDEVVHGKRSLLEKMPGDDWQRYANLRLYLAWMWLHPGKKLLFMGAEIAQHREWSHERELDWSVLHADKHQGIQRLVTELNHLYRHHPALHQLDHNADGYEWLDANDSEHSIFLFVRKAQDANSLYCIVNATPVVREAYRVGVKQLGMYREIFNSDAYCFGGSNVLQSSCLTAESIPWQGCEYSIQVRVPPLAAAVFVQV